MAQTRVSTVQQNREVYAALQYAASFHFSPTPKIKVGICKQTMEAEKHRTAWCAATREIPFV